MVGGILMIGHDEASSGEIICSGCIRADILLSGHYSEWRKAAKVVLVHRGDGVPVGAMGWKLNQSGRVCRMVINVLITFFGNILKENGTQWISFVGYASALPKLMGT